MAKTKKVTDSGTTRERRIKMEQTLADTADLLWESDQDLYKKRIGELKTRLNKREVTAEHMDSAIYGAMNISMIISDIPEGQFDRQKLLLVVGKHVAQLIKAREHLK